MIGWWLACAATGHRVPLPPTGLDAAVVPGCPNEADGRISECQWRRAAWGAELWRDGQVRNLLVSGAAAHGPHIEADTLAAALVAFGVPDDRVLRERQALHTDENVAWSWALADRAGFSTVGMASDRGHSGAMCWMARRWGRDCTDLPFDPDRDGERIADLLAQPRVLIAEAIPTEVWVAGHREPRMATRRGYTSFAHYARLIGRSAFRRRPVPPAPPPVTTTAGAGNPPQE